MTLPLKTLALFASTTLLATSAFAADPPSDTAIDTTTDQVAAKSVEVHKLLHQAAFREYDVRLHEFSSGRSPINVVLQSNRRILDAALSADVPGAAVQYDQRASAIETFAQRNLEMGTCTVQEVAQAKEARLDVLLKKLIARPDKNAP